MMHYLNSMILLTFVHHTNRRCRCWAIVALTLRILHSVQPICCCISAATSAALIRPRLLLSQRSDDRHCGGALGQANRLDFVVSVTGDHYTLQLGGHQFGVFG